MKAVFFDLDNTLIDRDAAVRAYVRQLLNRIRPDVSASSREALLERIVACDDHGYAPRNQWCRDAVGVIGPARISAEDLWIDFNARLTRYVKPPKVTSSLRRFCEFARTVLITNGSSSMQRAKLNAAGLADIFPDPLISEEVGIGKPDERIFRRAMAQAGVSPGETLMVGDDPRRDIDSAARIDIATCWISHGQPYPEDCRPPSAVFASIDDFFRAVEDQSLLSSISKRQIRNPMVGVI